MINELFEISCKAPHFCISLQLRLLKSESIWNIPSSTSSQSHTPWPASQTKYYVAQATHTSTFVKSRPRCTAARHIFSTISSQWLVLSWNTVSYLIYYIKNLITYIRMRITKPFLIDRTSWVSHIKRVRNDCKQTFFTTSVQILFSGAPMRQIWVLDVFWANCSNLNWWLKWKPSLTNSLKICESGSIVKVDTKPTLVS